MKVLCVFGRHAYGDAQRGESYEYANMLPAIKALGHEVSFFESWDKNAYKSFADLNSKLLDAVVRERPDVVFLVVMNYEIWIETLDAIRGPCGAVVVTWGPDDSWKYRESTRFFLPHVDIHCTTYPPALEWAAEGGHTHVLLTQWAANRAVLTPPKPGRDCTLSVSFVGTTYGTRRRWIVELERRGIEVQCFGHGWPAGAVSEDRMREIIRDSVITLNFADASPLFQRGGSGQGRQIKARIFEVPGAGGFLLTQDAEGLEECYRKGEEMIVFATVEDLASKIRRFLGDSEQRNAIAAAAYQRTVNCHTYEERLKPILAAATECARGKSHTPHSGDAVQWANRVRMPIPEPPGFGARILRAVLVRAMTLILGSQRGGRAARKLTYELYWRLRGERTYRAAGLPGRWFYRES